MPRDSSCCFSSLKSPLLLRFRFQCVSSSVPPILFWNCDVFPYTLLGTHVFSFANIAEASQNWTTFELGIKKKKKTSPTTLNFIYRYTSVYRVTACPGPSVVSPYHLYPLSFDCLWFLLFCYVPNTLSIRGKVISIHFFILLTL